MNDIRNTIDIIEDANQIKSSIVQKISESTVDDMAELMEHMSDEDIDGITMMIEVAEHNLTESKFTDKAKEIWSGAMKKAKKVFGGSKLGKLKGLMKRLSDKRTIMKGWDEYKARYKIEIDSMEDFVRYIKKEFPSLSGNTIIAATKDAPFKFDGEGNITNFDAFIIALSRNAEEALEDQISTKTGQVTDDGDDSDAATETKPTTSDKKVQRAAKANKSVKGGAINDVINQAKKEFLSVGNYDTKDWDYVASRAMSVKDAESAISDKKVRDFLAIIGYNVLNRQK